MVHAPAALPPCTHERRLEGLVVREHQSHHVAIWLARPQARNALNGAMLRGMTTVLRTLPASVRTVCIAGEGKAFCAGADLRGWQAALAQAETHSDPHQKPAALASALAQAGAVLPEDLQALFFAMQDAPQIVVAQVHGVAAAGGAGLVAAADIALCSQEASFHFSEVRLGLVPAMIAPFVERAMGPSVTRALFLTGQSISATQAQAFGLVHQVVPQAALSQAVADTLCALWQAAPSAATETKRLLQRQAGRSLQQQSEQAQTVAERVRLMPQMREGIDAFFAKRPPPWTVS